jgi:hypothetical protein
MRIHLQESQKGGRKMYHAAQQGIVKYLQNPVLLGTDLIQETCERLRTSIDSEGSNVVKPRSVEKVLEAYIQVLLDKSMEGEEKRFEVRGDLSTVGF